MALIVNKTCSYCGNEYMGEFYYPGNDCNVCVEAVKRNKRLLDNKLARLKIVRRKCNCRVVG